MRRSTLVANAALLVLLAACSTDPLRTADLVLIPEVPQPAVVAGTCDYNPTDAQLASGGWTRRFNEDFTGSLGQWTIWTAGAFNNELQHYQGTNLSVANGILSIAARKETVTGATTPFDPTLKTFSWTSGRIESVMHFSSDRTTPQVRMVARLKLPFGYGLWPAFWSYGDPWPVPGEIDIMEARSQLPYEYSTAYWWGRRSGVNLVTNSAATIQTGTSLTDCWHVFEAIWAKDALTYSFDGTVVDVKSGGYIPNMQRKQQRVTLNLAVGGLFFPGLDPAQIQPGTLQADWIKVFTR